jgi:hypothetical protein
LLETLISKVKLTFAKRAVVVSLMAIAACGILLGFLGAATEASPSQVRMQSGLSQMAANIFQSKLMELSATGPVRSGTLKPIVFTDDEVNSFFKYDHPQFLPPSVRDLNFHFMPDGIHGAANVNFDELKPSQQMGNQLGARLLASIFQGTQHLTAVGALESKEGTGTLTIKDVHIGSTVLSDWLVNWLIQTYVESEYKIDLSKPFLLPNHVTHIDFAPGKAILVRGIVPKK